MKRIALLFAFILLAACSAHAQVYPAPPNVGTAANRPATCVASNPGQPLEPQWYFATDTSALSICTALNTWGTISGGGGSGTVTSFSAGNLSPLFTTGVATATTTPALSFTISNAAQNSVLAGPASGGAGAYSFQTAPTFSAANLTNFPTFNQNTTGTAANLSGTPALPNGTTASTQAAGDSSADLATDSFVNTAIGAVNPAVAVLAASTGSNITGTYSNGVSGVGATFTVTATGAFTLDGVAINTIGQRVLLKDQTSAFQNGIYTATIVGATGISPVFTRALDYDQPSDINSTGAVPVQSGTANASTSWLLTSTVNTVGTDSLTFVQFSIAPTSIVTLTATQTLTNKTLTAAALGSSTATTQSSGDNSTKVATTAYVDRIPKVRALGWSYGDVATGSALTTSEVGYITVPFACTITGWHIMADAGTVTIKTARVNGGTALPTVGSNSISTSGVALASGTKIDSTTVTDFTSTAIAANDTLGFFITAVATAKQITFQIDCTTL